MVSPAPAAARFRSGPWAKFAAVKRSVSCASVSCTSKSARNFLPSSLIGGLDRFPVNDFERLPTHWAASFQIGVVDQLARFAPLIDARLRRFALPNVLPRSWIIMNGNSHV